MFTRTLLIGDLDFYERTFEKIVGQSPALESVLQHVELAALTNSTILIQGETGSGKELIARTIHKLSSRWERDFVKLNCVAILPDLLESQLFGREQVGFTGAIMLRAGCFELADKGTLFLNEVGEISMQLQPRLLRGLQEQVFERLGSTVSHKVDIRVIAATNLNLNQMVAENHFRRDLLNHLNVVSLFLPPLRERREDIPILVRHYVDKYARRMNRRIETIPAYAMEVFVSYEWPGNVRELQLFMERAVILPPGSVLRPPLAELEHAIRQASHSATNTTPVALRNSLEEIELQHES
jgi:formate hydrogenlyase transcriptional activator